MADKLLYENVMNEEAGFDAHADQAGYDIDGSGTPTPGDARTTVNVGTEGDTNTGDIAQTAPKVGFAHSVASKTLPAVLGYVQPMDSPSGFVFAMKKGPAVNQDSVEPYLKGNEDGTTTGPTPGKAGSEDLQITRKSVNTGIREVLIDCTNELTQDINSLFGDNFNRLMKKYLYYDGTDVDMQNDFELSTTADKESIDVPMAKVFIQYASWRMSRKTNEDFVAFLSGVAKPLGSYTVTTAEEIHNVKGVVAELKDYVYTNTGKTGRTWVLSSPKIINYLLMMSSTCAPDNKLMKDGKRIAKSSDYNYVFTCGEVDYYQDVNITDEVYCGITGDAGVASIFYTPYKEYFVQGGEDYYSGQSNIWFKLRDAWTTNPLDNGTGTADSQFVAKATVTFTLPSLLT